MYVYISLLAILVGIELLTDYRFYWVFYFYQLPIFRRVRNIKNSPNKGNKMAFLMQNKWPFVWQAK